MKQHITIDDLNQLTDKQKEKLREWWKPRAGDKLDSGGIVSADAELPVVGIWVDDMWSRDNKSFPLLSIGQMISFLYSHDYQFNINFDPNIYEEAKGIEFNYEYVNLCDALWEAVKYILSEDK
jgi:hypothetical protein